MDIFGGLRKLLGLDGGQKPQPQAQPVQQQPQYTAALPQTGQITPGYENAARDYEAAFQRGDFNSPAIIGQDPKNFGYPADEVQNYVPAQQLKQQPSITPFEEILKRFR